MSRSVTVEIPLPASALSASLADLVVEMVEALPALEVVIGGEVAVRIPLEEALDVDSAVTKLLRRRGVLRMTAPVREGPRGCGGEGAGTSTAAPPSLKEQSAVVKRLTVQLAAALGHKEPAARRHYLTAFAREAASSSAGRAVLGQLPVDTYAAAFGQALGAALDAPVDSAHEVQRVPWSPDAYLRSICQSDPVLFGGSPPSSLSLKALLANHAAALSVKWPHRPLPNMDLPAGALAPYFETRQQHPPNVVDADLPQHSPPYRLPAVVAASNLLVPAGGAAAGDEVLPFKPDLVVSPAGALTRFHIDSGLAVWNDHTEGEKDWAICDLADGLRLGLHRHKDVPLEEFLQAPSARICRITPGWSLFLPGGSFHFVVTRARSIAMSNNLVVAGSVAGALQLYEGTPEWAFDREHQELLKRTHTRAVRQHTNKLENGTFRQALVEECSVSPEQADQYLTWCAANL